MGVTVGNFPAGLTKKNKEKESEITCILFLQTVHLLKRNQYCYIASLLIIICLSINIHLTTGADIMYPNQSLSGDQTLVSSGEIFELGFFKLGNSSNYYIGMWYKKLSFRTIVWVANRETPIFDRYSAELKIKVGNLVLLNESNPVWSTNSNVSSSSSIVVVLLDDGNLVLREGSSSNPPIWQSSDHPTNTLLPGNKLAYNKLTRTKHVLTSWKSSNDPAKGRFSLEVDPNGTQCLLKWNMSEQYWSTGTWNGNLFSLLPEMRSQDVYTYHYISNENKSYLTYSVKYNLSIMSRFVLDVSGLLKLKQLNWLKNRQDWDLLWSQPEKQCQVYGFCGAFGVCGEDSQTLCDCLRGFKPWSEIDWNISDYSDGCVRKTNLQCGNTSKAIGEKYGFLVSFSSLGSSNHYLNVPIKNTAFVDARNRAGCETTCLEKCSCNHMLMTRMGVGFGAEKSRI